MTAAVGFVGDVMCHFGHVLQTFEGQAFSDTFSSDTRDLCRKHDEMWGNLEGPVSPLEDGLESHRRLQRTSCNSPKLFFPPSYLSTLRELGFQVFGIANNHCFDFETAKDVEWTEAALTTRGFTAVGRSFEPVVREIGGISFAIIATTSFLNIPVVSKDVALITDTCLPELLATIRHWSRCVDYVVVMTHWGCDYESAPPQRVRRLASELFAAGAKIIYGNHPHVLWPMEQPSRDQLICYSLGNFAQLPGCDDSTCSRSLHSGLLSLQISRTRIDPTLYPISYRHNHSAWTEEVGIKKSYWKWSASDVCRWAATLGERRTPLRGRVERSAKARYPPATQLEVERFYREIC